MPDHDALAAAAERTWQESVDVRKDARWRNMAANMTMVNTPPTPLALKRMSSESKGGKTLWGVTRGTGNTQPSKARKPVVVDDRDPSEMSIRERYKRYYNNRSLGCMKPRSTVRKALIYMTESSVFNFISLLVIIINSIFLALYDPTAPDDTGQNAWLNDSEIYFTVIFGLELVLRVMAKGFILHPYAYLRSAWNWLDMLIVLAGIAEATGVVPVSNVSSLRAFRVLRPLRTIKGVRGMRVLVNSLMLAVPLLMDVFVLWAFAIFIFAMAGVTLWKGVLKQQCAFKGTTDLVFDPLNTTLTQDPSFFHDNVVIDGPRCTPSTPSGRHCGVDEECIDSGVNINNGFTSFDNVGVASLAVFQILTLEGWGKIMEKVQEAYSFYSFLFFLILVVIGSYFLLQLALGVIYAKYQAEQERQRIASRQKTIRGLQSGGISAVSGRQTVGRTSANGKGQRRPSTSLKRTSPISLSLTELTPTGKRRGSDASSSPLRRGSDPSSVPSVRRISVEVEHDVSRPPPLRPAHPFAPALQSPSSPGPSPARPGLSFGINPIPKLIPKKPLPQLPDDSSSVSGDAQSGEGNAPPRRAFRPTAPVHAHLSNTDRIIQHLRVRHHQRLREQLAVKPVDLKDWRRGKLPPVVLVKDKYGRVRNARRAPAKGKVPDGHVHAFGKGPRLTVPGVIDRPGPGDPTIPKNHQETIDDGGFQHLSTVRAVLKPSPHMLDAAGVPPTSAADMALQRAKAAKVKATARTGSMKGVPHAHREASVYPRGHRPPEQKWRMPLFKLIEHKWFALTIIAVILINTTFLAVEHHGLNDNGRQVLRIGNFVFTGIFILELLAKVTALGPSQYIMDRFNIFDAVIVVISIVEFFTLGGGVLTVFRALRVLRVFKLINRSQSLQKVLAVITSSLMIVSNALLVLVLFLFIYAILGMQLFGGELHQGGDVTMPPPRANFDNFFWALVTVFQILTGENWDEVMHTSMRDTHWTACFYFLSLVVVGTYIFLNLFLAILLEGFQQQNDDQEMKAAALAALTATMKSSFSTPKSPLSRAATPTGSEGGASGTPTGSNSLETPPVKTAHRRKGSTAFRLMSAARRDRASTVDRETIAKPVAPDVAKAAGSVSKDKAVPVLEGKSLWLFGPESTFRQFCLRVIVHPVFEYTILFCIMVSSVLLAVEYPDLDPDSSLGQALYIFDVVFVIIFSLEAVLKIITLGFYKTGKAAYVRSPWNCLDGFVVIVSILSLSLSGNIKFLRVLRALRPLRIVARSPTMKIVLFALLRALAPLAYVLGICFLFWIVFGVLAVELFGGKLYYCLDVYNTDLNLPVQWRWQCPEGRWVNREFHFNWIGASMLTLFEVGTLEGWNRIMYHAVDAVGVDRQPERDHAPLAALFFLVYIFITAFFMMNVFIVVVVDNFTVMQSEATGNAFLTQRQRDWVMAQRAMLRHTPTQQPSVPPGKYRRYAFNVVQSKAFESFILIAILVNIVFMGSTYDGETETHKEVLYVSNIAFTIVYILEALLKLIGLGPVHYFRFPWNRFDFMIVLVSIVDLVFSVGLGATIARIFRVLRVFKLIRRARGLRLLFRTLIYSLPAIFNVGTLMILVLFIYAVAGVSLFGDLPRGNGLDALNNFEHFGNSVLLLFKVMTGDRWGTVMRACSDVAGYSVFFVSFMIIAFYIIANLFVALMLENFKELTATSNQVITSEDFEAFRDVWGKYDTNATAFVPITKLILILRQVPPPLGMGAMATRREIIRRVVRLELPDYRGYVHFRDVVIALSRRMYRVRLPPAHVPQSLRNNWQSRFRNLRRLPTTSHTTAQTYAALYIQSVWRGKKERRKASELAEKRRKRALRGSELTESERARYIYRHIAALVGTDEDQAVAEEMKVVDEMAIARRRRKRLEPLDYTPSKEFLEVDNDDESDQDKDKKGKAKEFTPRKAKALANPLTQAVLMPEYRPDKDDPILKKRAIARTKSIERHRLRRSMSELSQVFPGGLTPLSSTGTMRPMSGLALYNETADERSRAGSGAIEATIMPPITPVPYDRDSHQLVDRD